MTREAAQDILWSTLEFGRYQRVTRVFCVGWPVRCIVCGRWQFFGRAYRVWPEVVCHAGGMGDRYVRPTPFREEWDGLCGRCAGGLYEARALAAGRLQQIEERKRRGNPGGWRVPTY